MYDMYYNSRILIYVCIRVFSSLLKLLYMVGIYWLSDDAGAQVAIIYSYLDPMWSLDVLGQVMY